MRMFIYFVDIYFEFKNGCCISLLYRSIQDLSDHGAEVDSSFEAP